MKKTILFLICLIFIAMPSLALSATYYVEIVPTDTYYTSVFKDGVTSYQVDERKTTVNRNQMAFSGTSVCQIIDLNKLDVDGFITFQLKSLSGSTDMPLTGTTINAHWRGTNVDNPSAWIKATKNTIFSNIDVKSGATMIGYDLGATGGVTPFRFFRIEYESGVSKNVEGLSGVTPVGILFIR